MCTAITVSNTLGKRQRKLPDYGQGRVRGKDNIRGKSHGKARRESCTRGDFNSSCRGLKMHLHLVGESRVRSGKDPLRSQSAPREQKFQQSVCLAVDNAVWMLPRTSPPRALTWAFRRVVQGRPAVVMGAACRGIPRQVPRECPREKSAARAAAAPWPIANHGSYRDIPP